MPGWRRRTRSYVFNAVVVCAVVVLLANLGNHFSVVFPVEGHSMDPTIVQGDLAIIQPVSIATIRVGDMIVYKDGSIDVIHRVIRIQGSGTNEALTVKGDNNNFPDPVHVTGDLLVGKVDAVVLYLGNFVEQPYNYLLAVILICLLVADYIETERAKPSSRDGGNTPAGSS
jgi:signal peptidase